MLSAELWGLWDVWDPCEGGKLRRHFSFPLCFFQFAATMTFASAPAEQDIVLSECKAGGDTLQLVLRESSEGKAILAISAGNSSSRQSFNLLAPCLEQINKKAGTPLKIVARTAGIDVRLIATAGMDAARAA